MNPSVVKAKQGDVNAIASLINQSLQSKGIRVSGELSTGCLTLTALSDTVPDKSQVVDFIRKGITSLNPSSVDRVVIKGKSRQDKRIAWRDAFSVNTSPSIENTRSPKRNTFGQITNVVSNFRDILGIGLLSGIFLVTGLTFLKSNSQANSPAWEYRIEGIDDSSFDIQLLEYGADGWELAYARRATTGSGASSRGLYEVILKRPTSPREAKKNLALISQQLELEADQSMARLEVGRINRKQQAYYLTEQKFAASLEQLDIEPFSDTDAYALEFSLKDFNKGIIKAIPKKQQLQSYIGVVMATEGTTIAITCESLVPSRNAPDIPLVQDDDLQCASGSEEV